MRPGVWPIWGTIVLVGESLGRTAEMNLYPDVHARGLTLVGVEPP